SGRRLLQKLERLVEDRVAWSALRRGEVDEDIGSQRFAWRAIHAEDTFGREARNDSAVRQAHVARLAMQACRTRSDEAGMRNRAKPRRERLALGGGPAGDKDDHRAALRWAARWPNDIGRAASTAIDA